MTSTWAQEVDKQWQPFSLIEDYWHLCEGHEWERFDYQVPGRKKVERVTRCATCGAPRCDSYYAPKGMNGDNWDDMGDAWQQFYRCTSERHHRDHHLYLTGRSIPVGGDEDDGG